MITASQLDSLTRGTPGFLLAYGITLAPLLAVLLKRRAGWRGVLLAPFLTIPCLIAVAILQELLTLRYNPMNPPPTWLQIVTVGLLPLSGYLAGLFFTRRRWNVPDILKRGTVIEAQGRRPRPALPGTLTLASVAVPAPDETKHFKLIGTTGSGKSTAIRELIAGALKRGDRAIIADPDGGYLERFYNGGRGDVILNPFDERSGAWDLFGEIEQPYDVEQLARSLIPEGPDPAGHEWRGFARTFLASVLEYCKVEERTDLAELYRLLVVAEPEELEDLLAGSAAQPLLAGSDGRMFRAARGTATPVFNALKYAKRQQGAPLSVRRWARTGAGVLFLPYQADQIAALKGLIATWMRLAIFETMRGGERDLRLWFIVDELDALGAIDGLKDALARLRKFGGRCVLGFQSIAQVRGGYGDAEAQTIVENCGNTLILRCSASELGGTAEFASRLIGRREVIRRQLSRSEEIALVGGKGTMTASDHHTTEEAVMASEIEQLPDLEGYLKLASSPAWRRVTLRH